MAKILTLKKLQFEKFKNVNSFENFISEKLSKIIYDFSRTF